MRTIRARHFGVLTSLGFATFVTLAVSARQPTGGTLPLDNDDVGGVVTSSRSPETGVWVTAETTDLPTRFSKIVVTERNNVTFQMRSNPRAKRAGRSGGRASLDRTDIRQESNRGQVHHGDAPGWRARVHAGWVRAGRANDHARAADLHARSVVGEV